MCDLLDMLRLREQFKMEVKETIHMSLLSFSAFFSLEVTNISSFQSADGEILPETEA